MTAGTKNYFTSHISSYRVAMFGPWQSRGYNIVLRLLEYYSLNTYPIQALFVHLIPWHEFNVNNRHVRWVFLQPPKLADTKPNKKLGRFLDKICRGNPSNKQQQQQQQQCIYLQNYKVDNTLFPTNSYNANLGKSKLKINTITYRKKHLTYKFKYRDFVIWNRPKLQLEEYTD